MTSQVEFNYDLIMFLEFTDKLNRLNIKLVLNYTKHTLMIIIIFSVIYFVALVIILQTD